MQLITQVHCSFMCTFHLLTFTHSDRFDSFWHNAECRTRPYATNCGKLLWMDIIDMKKTRAAFEAPLIFFVFVFPLLTIKLLGTPNRPLIILADTAITLHNHSFRGGMDLGPWPTATNVGLHGPLAYRWASATIHAGHRKQSSIRKRSQDYSAAPNYCRNAVH